MALNNHASAELLLLLLPEECTLLWIKRPAAAGAFKFVRAVSFERSSYSNSYNFARSYNIPKSVFSH